MKGKKSLKKNKKKLLVKLLYLNEIIMPPKKSIQKVSNKVASKGAKNSTSNKKNSKDNTPKPKKTKEQKVNAPSRFINCHHDQHFQ